jgi:hypothetical protein
MNRSILVTLQKIQDSGEPVKFYNTFHGIPVNFQGKIMQISGARVLFNISSFQINCMLFNHGTFLKCKLMPDTLKAKVVSYNFPFETAELWNFEVTDATVGYRSEIRVEPTELTPCILFPAQGVHFRPTIIDISLKGIGLRINIEQFSEDYFQEGHKTSIYITLPHSDTEKNKNIISYDGEIRYLAMENSGKFFRIGLRTQPDKDTEKLLTHYIALRQKQLLADLKSMIEEGL